MNTYDITFQLLNGIGLYGYVTTMFPARVKAPNMMQAVRKAKAMSRYSVYELKTVEIKIS